MINELEKLITQEGNHETWEYVLDNRYKCEMIRNDLGVWCGYVSVPKGHPCFGLDYDAVHNAYPDLEVHGGLTYSEGLFSWKQLEGDKSELNEMIEKRKQETDYWTFGFDCNHAWDLYLLPSYVPQSEANYEVNKDNGMIQNRYGATYKNKTWVWNEVNNLARQFKEIEERK